MSDPVQAAVERSEAAMLVMDRHRGALFPHIAMLLHTFGPQLTRNIVSGAVEAVIEADRRIGDATVVPFEGDGRG